MNRRRNRPAAAAPRTRRPPADIPEVAPQPAAPPQPEPGTEAAPGNRTDTTLTEEAIRKMLEAAYT